MQSAAGRGLVDRPDEPEVLGRDALVVAVLDGGPETPRQSLHRRAVAKFPQPLLGGGADALLLLLDVRHLERTPAGASSAMVPERPFAAAAAPASALPILGRVVEARGSTGAVEARGRRLAWSTAVFSLATGVSRVVGLLRESVVRYYFGTVGSINAFEVAFLVPNTIRALVADAALSSAFVPVFSELLEKGERKRAWRVASSLFWLMLLGLSALTALFILVAPWIIGLFGDPGHDKALAVGLSRVLFPIVTLLGVSGIVVGILNSYDHFTVPAISPVFWNIAIIAGLAIGVPQAHGIDDKLYVYAAAILIGTVVQVLLPMPWLRGRDDRLRLVIDWRDPAGRQ